MSRVGAALLAGVREYRRTPVLLALLVVLPAYTIGVFTRVVPDGTAPVHVGGATVRAGLPEVVAALMAPMGGALFTAIAGLFLMGSAADADGRLTVAGYRPAEVVVARLGLLAGVAVAVTAVAMATMAVTFVPDDPVLFAVGTALAALIYGMVGVVVGLALPRLAGVYVLMFGSLVDMFLLQNPLATDTPTLAGAAPSHFPLEIAMAAAFGEAVAAEELALSVVVLAAVTAVAVAAFYRATTA